MEAKKLNEARVHELCAQYATENSGQVPSTTEIILLNGGKGSPSSANIYRKTYLLKVQEQTVAAGADPLANFPEAVANAVNAMQASLEAKAQEQVAAMEETLASKEAEWAEKLEAMTELLASAQEENAGLHAQVRELTLEAETQRVDNRDLTDRLAQVVSQRQQLETQLTESRAQTADLKELLSDVSPALSAQAEAIGRLEASDKALSEQVGKTARANHEHIEALQANVEKQGKRLEESHQVQQSLIQANTQASESVAYQAEQYQLEINRLNQLVDDSRLELEKARHADLAQLEAALEKKVDALALSSGDTRALLQEILEKLKAPKESE